MSARITTSVSTKNVFLSAQEVGEDLQALKNSAAAGSVWWAGALIFDWENVRKSGSGEKMTQRVTIFYVNPAGVKHRFYIRMLNEKNTGQIMPLTDQGVTELLAITKNEKSRAAIKPRGTKKPAIQIQKWNAVVQTAEDEITLRYGADGLPELPSDDTLSPYYRVMSLLGEAYNAEVEPKVELGNELVAFVNSKRRTSTAMTATEVLDAFNADNPRRIADIILSTDSVNSLRKAPHQDTYTVFTRGTIIVPNTKIAAVTQTRIGDTSAKNAGKPMPNPMTRVSLGYNDQGVMDAKIYDKDHPVERNGKIEYELAEVDGVKLNAENMHMFFRSGLRLDSLVSADSVCFSNMGISIPTKFSIIVASQPVDYSATIDDLYGDAPATPAGNASPSPKEDDTVDAEPNFDDFL